MYQCTNVPMYQFFFQITNGSLKMLGPSIRRCTNIPTYHDIREYNIIKLVISPYKIDTNVPMLPMYQCTNVPMYLCTNVPTCRYLFCIVPQRTNVPTYQCTNIPTYQRTNVPMYQCIPTYQRTNVPMYQCTNVPMYQHPNVPTN